MGWLAGFADRTHPLALPSGWVLASIGYFYGVYVLTGGESCCWTNAAQIWGAILNYVLISGYLMAAVVYQHRGHRGAVRMLAPLADAAVIDEALSDPNRWGIAIAVVLGTVQGALQFSGVLSGTVPLVNPWLDLSMAVVNAVLWIVIGFVAACRVSDALALRRLGARIRVDLYNLARLKPFGQVAIRDVLVIMGALALSPLQALDATFRLINYRDGLIVGLSLALALFLLPQTGVRKSVRIAKQARVGDLQRRIDGTELQDVAALEVLVAHRDRVQHLSTWPLDIALVSRVAFYLVIPPLAWVGAALVEILVAGMLG